MAEAGSCKSANGVLCLRICPEDSVSRANEATDTLGGRMKTTNDDALGLRHVRNTP